jgi:nitroreductase
MTSHTGFNDSNIEIPPRLDTRAPIHELLASRRSPRAYSERAVEPEKLLSVFEAARWSPSSANEQPWRFFVATKDDTRTFSALASSLKPGNRHWAERAPVLVLALAQTTYSKNGSPNHHALYDLGQSVAFLTVEATARGLSVHQMGGFDRENVRESLSIPAGFEPVVMFALGYAADPAILPEELQKREQAPRSRKSLNELVFTEAWGTPSLHVMTKDSLLTQHSTN